MVGFTSRQHDEPVYREFLEKMTQEELEKECRNIAVLFRAVLQQPDEADRWLLEACCQECWRRGKPQIFARAEDFIVEDPRK